MGRKRWWGLMLLLSIFNRLIVGDGEVGCLFNKNLCDPETCFNDLVFGRCIPFYIDEGLKDLYQYNLELEDLEFLKLQLERLESNGYKWSHPYTQCIIQNSLLNIRYRLKNDDFKFCEYLSSQTDNQFIDQDKEVDVDDAENMIRPIAVVKFTPSVFYPHGDYADELYYPPDVGEKPNHITKNFHSLNFPPLQQFPSLNDESLDERVDPYKNERKLKRSVLEFVNDDYYQPKISENLHPTVIAPKLIRIPKTVISHIYDDNDDDEKNLYQRKLDLEFLKNNMRKLRQNAFRDNSQDTYQLEEDGVTRNEDNKELEFLEENEKKQNNYNLGDIAMDFLPDLNPVYTEDGIVMPPQNDNNETPDDLTFDVDLNSRLWDRELAGFKRRERLDVKKPGPAFALNQYNFKTQFTPYFDEETQDKENEDDKFLYPPQSKKELGIVDSNNEDSRKNYKNVDLDHVYIDFEEPINIWMKGEHIVNETERLAGLNKGDLKDIRVENRELTFKVEHNNKNFTALDIVKIIEKFRSTLEKSFGVKIVRSGIGDKAKLPAMFEIQEEMSESMSLAIVSMAIAAALAGGFVVVLIANRQAKSRAKLAGLAVPDPEASKDYQELCRARMQAKQPTDKPDSPRVFPLLGRISESNNSSSNRSSTSSWSDEPALTNMDISTGHMVLSYMEDHLKNQDRLDEEWLSICAYEAEPCSTAIAEKEENAKFNRHGASLPYDHSRIVLNDFANVNNSDYINASTITDHDPRNPAYIATQGVLQETASEFWQLVWEQGSVVIVMLTRLTEEGKGMCYRYWPGEGSELYHIYEVHLVSEHIWCDDYLVRSFYLKNLRTGETRTVTQFHFLSWPENGVPHSTKALLEFRRKVNKSYRGRSCPIIVHCSDGAGRTGTYCLIDMVLNRMAKGAKEIDIAATLEHIRDQRPGMVSTKQQFEFVLMAVAEEVHAILKALPIPSTDKSSITLNNSLPLNGNSEH